MRDDVFAIEAHWPITGQQGAREDQEEEIYALACDLPEEFLIKGYGTSPNYGSTVHLVTYDQDTKASGDDFLDNSDIRTRMFAFEIKVQVLG
jgi:hypothetical protein